MSRTYRRKRGEKPCRWITHDYVCVEEFEYRSKSWRGEWFKYTKSLYVDIPRTGKDKKKHLAKYHADGYSHMNHVPSWFVQAYCNRPFRAKMKHEVRNIMKRGGDYEEGNFDPQKKDSLWMWW